MKYILLMGTIIAAGMTAYAQEGMQAECNCTQKRIEAPVAVDGNNAEVQGPIEKVRRFFRGFIEDVGDYGKDNLKIGAQDP